MKKIVLLILILISTGCYEESGKLVTTCTNKENINSLYKEIKYTIDFKADIVNNVVITYYYNDSDLNTLSSIKTSTNTSDKFIYGLRRNVEIDNDKEFKISYIVDLKDSQEILNKFYVQEKRSNLIKNLKEKGFECS